MELFVARQPIFDRTLRVFAYELLYRSGHSNFFDGHDENLATSKVISAAFYSSPGEDISGGKPAFINFPRSLLLNSSATILPPDNTVIEVLENVEPDREVVQACQDLYSRGYQLALDDFKFSDSVHPLARFAKFIKVDWRATTKSERQSIVSRYQGKTTLLAEKVETQEEFRDAVQLGFTYFQGYFFARPSITSRRAIKGFKLNYVRLLEQLREPELDFRKLAEIVRQESSLAFKLLRYVNSAWFGRRGTIKSIDQAILMIGELDIRRWLPMVVMLDLSSDKPNELAVLAIIRARFCELLASETSLSSRAGDLFLMGMISRLGDMLDCPLESLLPGLGLNHDIEDALLSRAPAGDRLDTLWRLALAYEAANWDALPELAEPVSIKIEAMPALYRSAVNWADGIFRV